jgi:aldose sugar dehydrogenase
MIRQRRSLLLSAALALAGCSGGGDRDDAPQSSAEAAAFSERIARANLALLANSPPSLGNAPPPSPLPPPLQIPPPSPTPQRGSTPSSPAASSGRDPQTGLRYTVVARQLDRVTDVAALKDGALVYAERDRGLSLLRADGKVQRLYTPTDLERGEGRGIVSVAADRDFDRNRHLYLLIASKQGGRAEGRLARLTLDAAQRAVVERIDLLSGLPLAPMQSRGIEMPIGLGRVRAAQDGSLFVGVGDALRASAPQSATDLAGKVLRIDRNGRAAPGRALPQGFDPRIWSYGIRDPRGLGVQLATDQLLLAEAGSAHGGDEVTLLAAGTNAGWDPACKGSAAYCGVGPQGAAMTDLKRLPGATPPSWTYARPSGLTGAAFLHGPGWREFDGTLMLSFSSGRRLEALRVNPNGQVVGATPLFTTAGMQFGGVAEGRQTDLYTWTDARPGGDEIWRVTPP